MAMERETIIEPGVFNVVEAAQYAGVSRPTMIAWINRNDFPAFRSGRRWLIPVGSFRVWLEKQAQQRAVLPGS